MWTKRPIEEKNDYDFKGLYKTTWYKTKSIFFQFSYPHWLIYECLFSFLIKALINSKKLIRFYHQAFIICKNRENLKILIEIFPQKLIVPKKSFGFIPSKTYFFFHPPIIVANALLFLKSLDPLLSLMSLFLENVTLHKYSFDLIVTTYMFALKLSKCNKLSKGDATGGLNVRWDNIFRKANSSNIVF